METQRKKGKLFVFFLMKYNFSIVHSILIDYKALVMQCRTGYSFQVKQRHGKQFAYCGVLTCSKPMKLLIRRHITW